MICLVCGKRKAQKHPQLGVMPCLICQQKGTTTTSPHEFVPQRILDDRKAHYKDTLQPYSDGTLSKEYLEVYGTKGITPTKDQVKNAKNVWTKDKFYKQ